MPRGRQRRLQSTLAAIQKQHGVGAVRKGSELTRGVIPPSISTGFQALDAITGCTGLPIGAVTLLSGLITSGKLTLGYKTLVSAQQRKHDYVAIIDLYHHSDPDYLSRCGLDLERLLLIKPYAESRVVDLLIDLVQTQKARAVLIDGFLADRGIASYLNRKLSLLNQAVRKANCALIIISEPAPPWKRWLGLDTGGALRQQTALSIEMQREQWLSENGEIVGYQANACVLKSRWAYGKPTAKVRITFNGAVKAGPTW